MINSSGWGVIEWTQVTENRKFLSCLLGGDACVISPRYSESPLYWLFNPSVRTLDPGNVDVVVRDTLSGRDLHIPGDNATVSGDDISFNTCQTGHVGMDFSKYEVVMHEAGHALGMSNFDIAEPIASYIAHPSIPDSVMNYDWLVDQIANEPDCSPHPVDIMAIESLYQTVVP